MATCDGSRCAGKSTSSTSAIIALALASSCQIREAFGLSLTQFAGNISVVVKRGWFRHTCQMMLRASATMSLDKRVIRWRTFWSKIIISDCLGAAAHHREWPLQQPSFLTTAGASDDVAAEAHALLSHTINICVILLKPPLLPVSKDRCGCSLPSSWTVRSQSACERSSRTIGVRHYRASNPRSTTSSPPSFSPTQTNHLQIPRLCSRQADSCSQLVRATSA